MSQPGRDEGLEPQATDLDRDLEPANPGSRRRQPRLPTLVATVAVGGVIGAETRYGLYLALPHEPSQWPWATILINISGCLLIGVLMVVITELVDAHPLIRPLLGVGFLGGYTTFSTYSVDILTLTLAGRWPLAAGYLVATPVLAVLAAAAGAAVTRTIASSVCHPRRARSSPNAAPPAQATTTDTRQHPTTDDNPPVGDET